MVVTRPEISVVIPYFDAQARLDLVLAGLDLQRLPPAAFEVLVADDGSPEPPRLGDHRYAVRLVRQPDLGFRAAAARNLGARATAGRLLCFLDGDVVPEPGYLAAMLDAAGQLDSPLLVGRRRHAELTGWSPADLTGWFDGSGPAPAELDEPDWLRQGYRRTRNLLDADEESYRYVISAVMAVDRELFGTAGGFDERFTAYGGEDWELANRCYLAGAELRHVPGAVAWHDGPDFAGRDIDRDAVMAGQQRALARLLPSPVTRPPGLVWRYPQVVIELDDTGWSPRESFRTVAAVLSGTDAGVWLASGEKVADPRFEDPRVHAGRPPLDVLRRCRYRVSVDAPLAPADVDPGLTELCARAPLHRPGLSIRGRRHDIREPRDRSGDGVGVIVTS